MLYLSPPDGPGSQIPPLSAADQQTVTTAVDQLAAAIHANSVLPLDQAYNPQAGIQPPQLGPGGPQRSGYITQSLAKVTQISRGESVSEVIPLYVATPAVLAHYGVTAGQIDPASDVITSRRDVGSLQIFDPSSRPDAPPEATKARGPRPIPRSRRLGSCPPTGPLREPC